MDSFDITFTIVVSVAIISYNARKAIIYGIFKRNRPPGKKDSKTGLSIKISGNYSNGDPFCDYHDNVDDAHATLDAISLIEETEKGNE